MKRALIVAARCMDCQPCPVLESCAMEAPFRETPEDKPWIDFYRCSGCMKCKPLCPFGAVEEIMQPCTGKGRMGW